MRSLNARIAFCFMFALPSTGCAESHARESSTSDAGFGLFDAAVDAADVDQSIPDATPDLVEAQTSLVGSFAFLVGTRDTRVSNAEEATWLVVGESGSDANARLVQPRFVSNDAVFDRVSEIPGTEGYEPIGASRDGARIAIVMRRPDQLGLLVVYDTDSASVLVSRALGYLPMGRPLHADVVYDDPNVTVVSESDDVNTLTLARMQRHGSDFDDVATWSLPDHEISAAIRDADGRGAVVAAESNRNELSTWHVSDTDFFQLDLITLNGTLPSWDLATLAYLDGNRWQVGEEPVDTQEGISLFNGEPSLARYGDRSYVLANGINFGTIRAWYKNETGNFGGVIDSPPDSRDLGGADGFPVAHIDRTHAGVFYLHSSLTSANTAVRYLALPLSAF